MAHRGFGYFSPPESRGMRLRHATLAGLAGLALLWFAAAGCDLESLLADLGLTEGPAPLSGQNAFVHLRARAGEAAAGDTDALLHVLAWRAAGGDSTDSEARFRPPAEILDLLQSTARRRQNIRPAAFGLVDFEPFAAELKTRKASFVAPDLNSLDDEYVIPRLKDIPVRNQGSRGTCAAFAGIGHVEYATLLKAPHLSTVNLSEQRFYWASRPDCHDTTCTSRDAGSWYGDGFQASINAAAYDIPLETSCPYNPNQTDNELQTPLAQSCEDGVVQVRRVRHINQPADIIRVLEEDGLPVPFASPLSSNYFQNDGLITLEEAGSAAGIQHAEGHAYLIVGYRKLPRMPEEGGMCFIIRNSWGPGWGVGGYSCVTLAWIQEWHFGFLLDHPVVVELAVSSNLGGQEWDDTLPDLVDCEVYDDPTVDCERLDEEAEIPPAPEPDGTDWVFINLVGPDGRLYQAERSDEGEETLMLRGTLRESGLPTGAVLLGRRGETLVYDGDEVGRIEGGDVTLCTGPYDMLCALRFEPRDNRLYVEFIHRELRRVQAGEIGAGRWVALDALPLGVGLEFFQPNEASDLLLRPLYVRGVGSDGEKMEPVRLILKGLDIQVMGTTVGSIAPDRPGLCTGPFSGACGLFARENRLVVLPSW